MMIRVLEFFGEPLEYGGQEAFMINMYKNFNSKDIEYTFCTPFHSYNKNLIELAKKRQEKIISYNYSFLSKLRKIYIIKSIKRILKTQKFDVVHIQTGSVFNLYYIAKIAKRYGVKQVIAHSHSTGKSTFMYRIIKRHSDKKIEKYVDKFLACSILAGKNKFPKKVMEEDRCIVIKNGIDSDRFKFDQEMRKKYCEKLGLKPGEFTLLHVGRFAEQKNHKFLVEVVEELSKKAKNFRVILIGEGELKEQTLREIKDKGLEKYFIVLEKRNDVAEIMMAADMFVFPSIFEGLGIVAVEAQCSGLQTIVSKEIPEEANITDLITYLDLNVDDWVRAILKKKGKKPNREKYAEIVLKQGFDAKTSAAILEKIYLGEE